MVPVFSFYSQCFFISQLQFPISQYYFVLYVYSLPSNYVQLINSFVALSARWNGEGETQHRLLYFTSLLGDSIFFY